MAEVGWWPRLVRAVVRPLVFVVARGAPPDPLVGPAGLRGLRWVVAAPTAVAAVVLANAPFRVFRVSQLEPRIVLSSLLAGLPVVLAVRYPLVAWRLIALQVLLAPFTYPANADLERWWGWPWVMGLTISTGFVLFALAESYDGPVVVAAWALTTAAAWPHLPDWREHVLAALLGAGVMVLGNTLRSRRRADLRRVAEQSRAAALEERTRIARELHDVVSHHMSVLVLRADAAPYRLPGLAPEVRAEFQLLQDIARDGLTEMRRMLGALRSDGEAETAPQPGVGEIEELVRRFGAAGTAIELDIRCGPDPLPVGIGPSAYRIVREALSNSARHAPGAAVAVGLAVDAGRLRITVSNTAAARPALDAGGDRPRQGLAGMAERVRVLGGEFRAAPTPDGGFAVIAELPLGGRADG
ncbi:signal transduction histidine kinase [Saccharothrix coeruleofusca]|uniref:sensor histidine kinase n=1 Tax=Saccharothrix coeruleofusca TaxID=33919 RepID=UPI001AEB0A49|nr:histidine kinase [Saccharothrix coeruleofusca]MBP2337040.1 signal transduction histidine kinase [Saccharothrix coeruleofusca]